MTREKQFLVGYVLTLAGFDDENGGWYWSDIWAHPILESSPKKESP